MDIVWNDRDFVAGWNATYGLDMARAPIRAGIVYPLIAEAMGKGVSDIVEFGCGNGNLSHHFQHAAFNSWRGFDGGDAVLATARAHVTDPRVTFQQADLTQPIPDMPKADLLAAIFVIEELPLAGLTTFFGNAAKALRPTGRACFFSNHPVHALAEDLKSHAASLPNLKFKGHQGYFDTRPSTYALELLNQRDGMKAEAVHHHKPLSAILNAAIQGGLTIEAIREVPAGIGTLNDWAAHAPRSGDVPRFLYLEATLRP